MARSPGTYASFAFLILAAPELTQASSPNSPARERIRAELLQARHWTAEGRVGDAYLVLKRISPQAVEAEGSYRLTRGYYFALGKAARQTGRFREAREAYSRIAELARKAGDLSWEAQARYGVAAVRFDELSEMPTPEGRKELIELAGRAKALAQAAGDPTVETQALWMLGSLEDASEAGTHLKRCFEVAANLSERSFCRSALARRLADTDPGAAEEAMQEAQALAERSGDVLAQTSAWHQRMRVSWEIGPPDRALADARAGLDAIEALRDKQGGSAAQPGLFSTWAEDYYWLSGQLLEAGRLEPGFGIIERMRARTLIDALGLDLPGPGRFATLGQVRGALGPGEALLSFQVAPWKDLSGDFGGGSWLLVSTRTATRRYRLPGRTEVRSAVDIFTGLFEERDGSEAESSLLLHRKLVALALAELPREVRRLVIVPDDALHRLPFAILRPEPGAAPLATRYEMELVPSATLWLRWRTAQASPARGPALVLADPAASIEGLGPLPFARNEGKAVVRHLGDGKLLEGEAASEVYIKRQGAGGFGLVHFATHSWMDEVEPDRSFVLLSSGEPQQDGRLQIREIVELDLDGRTVVLSSCESASGEVLRGEGVMGLARAFFQAGAHTVVASLWPLRDDDGAALFDRFYRHLSRGKSVSAALQAAQRDRLEDGAPAAAWAGVVVLGNGGRVPLPGGRRGLDLSSRMGTSLLAAAALLSLVLLVLRRRRMR